MTTSKEGSNPLRPYYIPPSLDAPPGSASKSSPSYGTSSKHTAASTANASFGPAARNLLSDLDYSDYLSDTSPSAAEIIKGLSDQAAWKYTSVLLAQPFEVARIVLQVQNGGSDYNEPSRDGTLKETAKRKTRKYEDNENELSDSDSDPDCPSYFTSIAPLSHIPSDSASLRHPKNRYRSSRSASPSPSYRQSNTPHDKHGSPRIHRLPRTTALLATITNLWTTEGAFGIWKGTNSTFIYSILTSSLTAFLRSILCALLAIPDPGASTSHSSPPYLLPIKSVVGGLDVLSLSNPLKGLIAAVSAAGIAGVILAPLDIVRTRLLLTPSTHPPRGLWTTLQSLPSFKLPLAIAPVTILHSTLPTLISVSTPLFLRSRLAIDPVLTPSTYSIATFISQVFELAVRLPIETVLRRGQMSVLSHPFPSLSETSRFNSYSESASVRIQKTPAPSALETIVPIGRYKGLLGTVYYIVFEEGEQPARSAKSEKQLFGQSQKNSGASEGSWKNIKGQGLEGLWRGWRVGIWGLIGVWGAAMLGGAGRGGEF